MDIMKAYVNHLNSKPCTKRPNLYRTYKGTYVCLDSKSMKTTIVTDPDAKKLIRDSSEYRKVDMAQMNYVIKNGWENTAWGFIA